MKDSLFNLEGRVAVITGGMGQLGLICAAGFAERGCRVAIVDMETSPKLTGISLDGWLQNGRIKLFQADITKRGQLEDVCRAVEQDWGTPHILINNAALDSPPDAPMEEVGPFETYPETSFDKIMAVNVKGAYLCCQVFGGRMADQERGSIINVSSIYGLLSPCQDVYDFRRKRGDVFFKPVAYSVSKSAILNLTRYLATYWGRKGVRVNTLTPAGVFNRQDEEFLAAYEPRVPMGRMAKAEELLGVVVFLASDASSYMTGANLVVDGGYSAW